MSFFAPAPRAQPCPVLMPRMTLQGPNLTSKLGLSSFLGRTWQHLAQNDKVGLGTARSLHPEPEKVEERFQKRHVRHAESGSAQTQPILSPLYLAAREMTSSHTTATLHAYFPKGTIMWGS